MSVRTTGKPGRSLQACRSIGSSRAPWRHRPPPNLTLRQPCRGRAAARTPRSPVLPRADRRRKSGIRHVDAFGTGRKPPAGSHRPHRLDRSGAPVLPGIGNGVGNGGVHAGNHLEAEPAGPLVLNRCPIDCRRHPSNASRTAPSSRPDRQPGRPFLPPVTAGGTLTLPGVFGRTTTAARSRRGTRAAVRQPGTGSAMDAITTPAEESRRMPLPRAPVTARRTPPPGRMPHGRPRPPPT